MLEDIKITDAIQALVAVVALSFAIMTVDSWKNQKRYDLLVEAEAFEPRLLILGHKLFEIRFAQFENIELSPTDSLVLKTFKGKINEYNLANALISKTYFLNIYEKHLDDIIECQMIAKKIVTRIQSSDELQRKLAYYYPIISRIEYFRNNAQLIEASSILALQYNQNNSPDLQSQIEELNEVITEWNNDKEWDSMRYLMEVYSSAARFTLEAMYFQDTTGLSNIFEHLDKSTGKYKNIGLNK